MAPTALSVQEPMMCAGCGGQVCDRFFLLAAGQLWHSACLRCSQCQCELQTQPSLYCRDGNIYCQQDYCRSDPEPPLVSPQFSVTSLFCQSHYHGDGSIPLSQDPPPKPNLTDEGECVCVLILLLLSFTDS
uniref:LIM zinc-binding domain-containing protein n=1 Tax=Echeneis naucrates TaxID=173247 RepID=A0A665U4H9_ECHNA